MDAEPAPDSTQTRMKHGVRPGRTAKRPVLGRSTSRRVRFALADQRTIIRPA